jgi:hypothetical protein
LRNRSRVPPLARPSSIAAFPKAAKSALPTAARGCTGLVTQEGRSPTGVTSRRAHDMRTEQALLQPESDGFPFTGAGREIRPPSYLVENGPLRTIAICVLVACTAKPNCIFPFRDVQNISRPTFGGPKPTSQMPSRATWRLPHLSSSNHNRRVRPALPTAGRKGPCSARGATKWRTTRDARAATLPDAPGSHRQ